MINPFERRRLDLTTAEEYRRCSTLSQFLVDAGCYAQRGGQRGGFEQEAYVPLSW
jgi:hypothetical protein